MRRQMYMFAAKSLNDKLEFPALDKRQDVSFCFSLRFQMSGRTRTVRVRTSPSLPVRIHASCTRGGNE
jgi:hypothetical protein